MISYGTNIHVSNEELQRLPVVQLYEYIKSPTPEIVAKISQLRILRTLDRGKYTERKSLLPYFVCANFNPRHRRISNFAYTEYFVTDIDHIAEKGLNLHELKNRLKEDTRVVMCFTSPSEDGLKLLFKLSERCYDHNLYKLFYKAFCQGFSEKYGLEQVIDAKTCDVARACFMSYDPDAYFNCNAVSVSVEDFMDLTNDDDVFLAAKEMSRLEASQKDEKIEVQDDVLSNIKDVLGLKSKSTVKTEKQAIVPERLNQIIDHLVAYLEQNGVKVTNVKDINYGKKLQLSAGLRCGEVNLFYGKGRFNPVISPKSGTSAEFNQLAVDLISLYIHDNIE